jgi:hypothetical protein
MVYKKQPWYRRHRRPLMVLAVLLIAVLVLGILEFSGVTHFFHKTTVTTPSTGSIYTKGEPAAGSTTGSSCDKTPAASNSATSPLIAPTGTFANVYQARLSDQMGSTCNTTPGASCQIIFTLGGTTKSLPKKTADSGGAVYWSWHPNDSNVGLAVGTWHVSAVATLGSQSKTTDNGSLELTIRP